MTAEPQQLTEIKGRKLPKAAICLHWVCHRPAHQEAKPADSNRCGEFCSFELDLLAHVFQKNPPLDSRLMGVTKEAELVLPGRIEFASEGKRFELQREGAVGGCIRRKVQLSLSRTSFHQSGVCVDHLVISNNDHGLDVYDLITLIKTYGGREEQCKTSPNIGLVVDDGPCVSLNDWACGKFGLDANKFEPVGGTVQVTGVLGQSGIDEQYLGRLQSLMRSDHPALVRELNDKIVTDADGRPKSQEGVWLNGLGGIIQGIFNCDRIDGGELADVLEATVPEASGLLRVHKGTLFSYAVSDQVYDVCCSSIGISPYLILPHAAVLHNEFMLANAARTLSYSSDLTHHAQLQRIHRIALRRIDGDWLSNIFHYTTESALFERSVELDGLNSRREHLRGRLGELAVQIENLRSERSHRAGAMIQSILAVIGAIGFWQIINEIWNSPRGKSLVGPIVIFVILIVAVFGVSFTLYRKAGGHEPPSDRGG